MIRFALTLVAIAAALPAAGEGRITWPEQAIVTIVPAPRGGGTDLFARHLAELVESGLGQRVIVDNRPRDGGAAGVERMTRARPDGYTLAFAWNSPLTATAFEPGNHYRPTDFRAVMSIGYSSYVLCVRPDFPAEDAAGLIAALQAAPGAYSYGTDGAGGLLSLAVQRIFTLAGVQAREMAFVGATETARNFLAGDVDIYGGSLAAILPHAAQGEAKCLLLTSADDNPAAPRASGLRALGMTQAETVLWWGLIAPAALSDDVVARLEAAFLEAAAAPEFRADMERRGAVWRPRGAAETDSMLAEEIAAFRAPSAAD